MIKACYLPGAHLKIIISLNGHILSFGLKTVQELDDSIFHVFLAGVIPTQVENIQEVGDTLQAVVCARFKSVCILLVQGWNKSRI